MRNDSEIYNDMGAVLVAIAPKDACKVIMRAKLSEELDTCSYEYDYIDDHGKSAWLTAGGRANTDMLDLLVELRKWYIKNKLTADLPAWNGCEVTLDLANEKLGIDFTYP
ncbi:hypothetical protein AO067_02985 [Pseudomonas viridiflava ICMP 13104]|uniref:Uncharacterized protein n=1 Tax=Pseudomonas viridiflava ICMP 13104 TaxID=1198305 RepID=A0A0W0H6U4_PSEVI|nr:hypothetical protein AO067_02985 [Pseudomonas viridiflava ICMP 13104]